MMAVDQIPWVPSGEHVPCTTCTGHGPAILIPGEGGIVQAICGPCLAGMLEDLTGWKMRRFYQTAAIQSSLRVPPAARRRRRNSG